ncbi:MAG: CRISPR-associated endonuclease Cas1 [Dehalococcoidia bacterium]
MLQASGERLVVSHEGNTLTTAGVHTLEAVVLHGAVQVTSTALARLLAAGIPCIYVALDGRLKGRLEPFGHPAAVLRGRQALAAADPASRLQIAKQIVRSKLTSQTRLLRALARPEASRLVSLLPRVRDAATLDELRGLEGWAGRIYFAVFRDTLDLGDWRRTRRPVADPLNALISYGYALLLRPAAAAIATVGLDPYQGFLHQPGRARPALVLDLIEEFRAPLIDLTVLHTYRSLREGTGWYEATPAGPRLSLETRKSLIAQFESRLNRQTMYRPTGRREQVGRFFELQARALARTIQSGTPYRPAW